MKYNLDLVEETMTSVQLAELSGRRHDNLIVDIEQICENSNFPDLNGQGWNDGSSEISTKKYTGANGKEHNMFVMNKDAILLVVSKANDELRRLLIKRYRELENEVREKEKRVLEFVSKNSDKLALENNRLKTIEFLSDILSNQKSNIKKKQKSLKCEGVIALNNGNFLVSTKIFSNGNCYEKEFGSAYEAINNLIRCEIENNYINKSNYRRFKERYIKVGTQIMNNDFYKTLEELF